MRAMMMMMMMKLMIIILFRSLAMRAMREDAESVAASRSVRRTAVVTAA